MAVMSRIDHRRAGACFEGFPLKCLPPAGRKRDSGGRWGGFNGPRRPASGHGGEKLWL
jgi:hypothetical protein